MTRTDDEDWLYRRGRYADGGQDQARAHQPPPPPPQSPYPTQPPPVAPSPRQNPPTQYGVPTPVGHGRPGSTPRPPTTRGNRATRRRRPVRGFVTWLLVLVLLYLVGIPAVTWAFMPRVDAAPDGRRPANTASQIYVLAGSDSREGLSTQEQDRLGTGSDAGRRTDTIMMLYVPPVGRAALISVPRDSYLAIPGHGRNKVNAAYALGGPELLVDTLEQATGLRVDGYAEIGFGGFANVVDAVGGIEMCPPTAIKDRDSNLDIPAGCQQMDGATALGYVRMRKADPEGDLGRAKRQREMISGLARKTLSPATVALPWRWWGVNWALSRGITADLSPLDFLGMANGAVRMGTGAGDQLVVPIGDADAQTAAGSSVLWDARRSTALFEAMARGEGDLKQYA